MTEVDRRSRERDEHGTSPAGEKEARAEVILVTGLSGAGLSTAATALEDLGWYVADNLPPQLVISMVDLAVHADPPLERLAVVMDVRSRLFTGDLGRVVTDLAARPVSTRVLFLDASDDVLVRRFESVRRPHPLQGEGTLLDGIHRERARLARVRESADLIVDTSNNNIHQLATRIVDLFATEGSARHTLTVMSFGFKYGLPSDADLVADMRFLPNPFWVEDLKSLTGKDDAVRDYVFSQPGAEEFLDAYVAALQPVLAGYQRENKPHSTVAVGCTGGKHRSVATAEELARRLAALPGVAVRVKHRDLGRE